MNAFLKVCECRDDSPTTGLRVSQEQAGEGAVWGFVLVFGACISAHRAQLVHTRSHRWTVAGVSLDLAGTAGFLSRGMAVMGGGSSSPSAAEDPLPAHEYF